MYLIPGCVGRCVGLRSESSANGAASGQHWGQSLENSRSEIKQVNISGIRICHAKNVGEALPSRENPDFIWGFFCHVLQDSLFDIFRRTSEYFKFLPYLHLLLCCPALVEMHVEKLLLSRTLPKDCAYITLLQPRQQTDVPNTTKKNVLSKSAFKIS